MLKQRCSKLPPLEFIRCSQQILPTGNGFGGSNLKLDLPEQSISPIVASAEVIADRAPSIDAPSSPLVIEAGKILLLACWLWCSLGANFCSESITAIVCSLSQDA
jgi:hypothetical protein